MNSEEQKSESRKQKAESRKQKAAADVVSTIRVSGWVNENLKECDYPVPTETLTPDT